MIINSYQINDGLQLTPMDPEKIPEASQSPEARTWIDVHTAETNEIEAWLDKTGTRNLARRLFLEASDRSGFYPLKKEIFLAIPVLAYTEIKFDRDYLALLCRENLLLTFHRKPIFNPKELAVLNEADDWLPDSSIAGLVSALMIDISQEGLRHTADLRSAIHVLEERMDHAPDAVEAEEIRDMRSGLMALDAVVSDQLPSVRALSATDKPFFRLKDAREYMNCALANLQAAERSLDRQDGRISALRSGFQMHAQDRTNRKLGMLTILSAIFMPITLLAGVWGMNFENMPELKLPFSYPIGLGVMALVGCGMYRYFRRTGWFD